MVWPQPLSTMPMRPAQPEGVQQVPSLRQTWLVWQGLHTWDLPQPRACGWQPALGNAAHVWGKQHVAF